MTTTTETTFTTMTKEDRLEVCRMINGVLENGTPEILYNFLDTLRGSDAARLILCACFVDRNLKQRSDEEAEKIFVKMCLFVKNVKPQTNV